MPLSTVRNIKISIWQIIKIIVVAYVMTETCITITHLALQYTTVGSTSDDPNLNSWLYQSLIVSSLIFSVAA